MSDSANTDATVTSQVGGRVYSPPGVAASKPVEHDVMFGVRGGAQRGPAL